MKKDQEVTIEKTEVGQEAHQQENAAAAESKKSKSFASICTRILIAIVAVIIVFFAIVIGYFKIPVSKYYSASDRTFKIPAIRKGFIPQGLSYDGASGDFYITGYEKEHTASPIYIVDREKGKIRKYIRMANPDGSEFTGHNGGIEMFNGKVYVAGSNDSCLYVYDPAKIRLADDGSLMPYEDIVELKSADDSIPVAFVTSYKDKIIAGEFYRDVVYPTSESHWIETENGLNKAIAVAFDIEGNTATPAYAYSLPHQVQGMYVDDDNIYLSTSYGAVFSHILRYSQKDVKESGLITVLGKTVPLYVLDADNLAKDTKIAPMSEEIEIVNGRMYTMCESASDKYIFGKFTGAVKCYATDVTLFE